MHPALTLLSWMAPLDIAPPPPLAEVADRAIIWGGFEQDWTYNHRINRLGDYVGDVRCAGEACTASVTHGAASGKGSDVASYSSHFSAVSAPGVGFVQGSTTFHAHARHGEGNILRYTATEELPARGLIGGRQQLHVVLGGFDLLSIGDPEKLSELSMSVDNARYDASGNVVRFDVALALRADCDSVDCRFFDRTVDYDVSVAWTLMAADQQLAVSSSSADVRYAWERASREAELAPSDFVDHDTLQGSAGAYAAAFVAFQALSIRLDQDHYLQDWTTALSPGAYQPATGRQDVDVALLFKQWNRLSETRLWSYTDRGAADISASLALIQLREGSVTPQDLDGAIAWRANGKPSDRTRSQAVHEVAM